MNVSHFCWKGKTMTDLTELFQFRSVADGIPSPAPSRYRAVRNALASVANNAQMVSVESRKDGTYEWNIDPEGMAQLEEQRAKFVNPEPPVMTLRDSIRELGNICRLLSGRETLTTPETEVLAHALSKVAGLMDYEWQAPVENGS